MKKTEAYYGKRIHEMLNQTLFRKLTLKEYRRLILDIQRLLETARETNPPHQ